MSSHSAVYYGKSKDKPGFGSKNTALRKVPNHPTYNMDRFIGGSGQVVSHQQRQSPGSGRAEVETRAIAARQARATAILHAFDTQFSHSSKPPKR
ncbi:hypothetical protein ACSS6W_005677 [Trichoderma asperelloides]